jgi:hypothetical protein
MIEMIRLDIRETVGQYLTAMMGAELTCFLGREPHVLEKENIKHRNGSYDHNFTLKGIGMVEIYGEADPMSRTILSSASPQIRKDLSGVFVANPIDCPSWGSSRPERARSSKACRGSTSCWQE